MSWLPDNDPACRSDAENPKVDVLIQGRERDLGGFQVRRTLPSAMRRLVGPFIFWDEMGPATMAQGKGVDVRPHPHINLATVTYLFQGEIFHRDSLGSAQSIAPGDVNWMIAGRGIAHSERTPPEERARGPRLHGIQCWLALPKALEEVEPSFTHHPKETLPVLQRNGVRLCLIAGSAFGEQSPVKVLSPTLYAEAKFDAGATLELADEHEERAAYVVSGKLRVGQEEFGPGDMPVFARGGRVPLRAEESSRVMLLGGQKLDGERLIYWNFVASSQERLERAKSDWKEGRFPKIPGDDQEFIPLPD